jgi:lycopene cyclase domain-containing protein
VEVFQEGEPEKPEKKTLVNMSTYFLILAGSFVLPLLLSFDRKVAFYKNWKYLFPAVFITAAIFIVWDVYFTRIGVWGFAPEHLSGIHLVSLPLEECLFFVVIPYASVFTYDVVKAYFLKIKGNRIAGILNLVLLGASVALTIIYRDRAYTLSTFFLVSILLILHQWILKREWMNRFYFSYALVLFPFLIVNGLLTGTAIPGEVVWYNDAENIGIRIGTIPVEDIFYGFSLILMNVTLYEYFRGTEHPGRR